MKKQAIWKDTVLAESNDLIRVEGNYYFPKQDIRLDFFQPSSHHTVCSWKGTASYYNLQLGEKQLANAAWYYPDPKEAAQKIEGRVAFDPRIQVIDAE